MAETVAVADLQIGMFVHLDLGWMAHPFPLSSFRIACNEEIATLRGLGLSELRWIPEKSCLPLSAPSVAAPAAPSVVSLAAAPAPVLTPLQAQRAAMRQCSEQYGQASTALRRAAAQVVDRPEAARRDTEALTRGLLDKLLAEPEMSILVLSGGLADKATAHAMNVTIISLLMARAFGLSDDELMDVGVGALWHDVGKTSMPPHLQQHDERFDAGELQAYRDHVKHGVALGLRMGLAPGALQVLAQHHESADGSGFPQRLGLDRMTPASRIVSLVNRYEDLCNPGNLARAITPHEALSRLFAQSRSKFDATMLNAFIRMMGVYPAGSIVQLTDDRYAMVVSVNAARPLKPRVMVHDPEVQREQALLLNLSTAGDIGIRRSLSIAQLPAPAREFLQPTPRVAYFFVPSPAPDPAAGLR